MNRSQFVRGAAASAASFAALGAGGTAWADAAGGTFSLGNAAIDATWAMHDGALSLTRLRAGALKRAIPLPRDLFSVGAANGTIVSAREFRITGGPAHEALTAGAHAARYAERIPGRKISVELAHPGGKLHATWSAILRDGSQYLRQQLELRAVGAEVQLASVMLVDFARLPDAFVLGSVDGSPIASANLYTAIEHPFAKAQAIDDRASAFLPVRVPLRPGVPLIVSSVIGVTAPGRLRRDFLTYVERERAHPYRTFLHYNSWYDLGYFTRYTAAQALERIHAFGSEAHAAARRAPGIVSVRRRVG